MAQPLKKKEVKKFNINDFKSKMGLKATKESSNADKPMEWLTMPDAYSTALKLPGIPENYVTTVVGHSNVGKSTLMNLLAKSDVFAENKLFATLDTTVRKVIIENLPFLLSDTVGFIRKLPTDLVESFKSTLDEVREADLLLHVVDISHPDFEDQIKVVEKTLADLGCSDKPLIIVFNKTDAYTFTPKEEDDLTPKTKENVSLDELMQTWMAKMHDSCIFISARERDNIENLKTMMYNRVRELHVQKYPYNDFLYQTYEE